MRLYLSPRVFLRFRVFEHSRAPSSVRVRTRLSTPHSSSMSLRIATRTLTQRRAYAVAATSAKDRDSTAGDSRLDIIRKTLYPIGGVDTASSPTGTYQPDHQARLAHVLGSNPEVHETIERAWKTHQRSLRESRQAALAAKHAEMVRACEALKQADERLYAQAMVKPDIRKSSSSAPLDPQPEGGKTSLAEKRRKAARIEGLFPREWPVARETWGKEKWYAGEQPGKQ